MQRLATDAMAMASPGLDTKSIITRLCTKLKSKKHYDLLFETEEEVARVCAELGFSVKETDFVQAMREKKDVFVPNPLLDHILTAVFLAECYFVLKQAYVSSQLALFVACMAVTAVGVFVVKRASAFMGRKMSKFLVRKGFVDSDPLAGPVQMKKWTEQSWQLAIHVFATALEYYLLTVEPWWTDPITCWIPHPKDQQHSALTVYFYVQQLAIWVFTCMIHRFFDERRKDYFVMYIHHVCTIGLVGE